MPTAKEVDVKMGNAFAGVRTVVDDDPIAASVNPFLFGNGRRDD